MGRKSARAKGTSGDPLVKVLSAAPSPDDGDAGMTVKELCERFGWTVPIARERVRRAIAAGDVVSGRGYRANLAGHQQRVPVYRAVKARGG